MLYPCSLSHCSLSLVVPLNHLSAPHPLWVLGCFVLHPVAAYFAMHGWSKPPTVNPAGMHPANPEAPLRNPSSSVNPALDEGLSFPSRPVPSSAAKTAQAQATCQENYEKERRKECRSRAQQVFSLLSLAATDTTSFISRHQNAMRHQAGWDCSPRRRHVTTTPNFDTQVLTVLMGFT